MNKKNSKDLKANKTSSHSTNSKVEFADEINLSTSKKANKHSANKHSDYSNK